MKTFYLIVVLLLCLSGCGQDGSNTMLLPKDSGGPDPVISGFSVTPSAVKVNSGYGWNGYNWPQYGCGNTVDLTLSFHLSDNAEDVEEITYIWTDSLGKLSGSRTDPYGKKLYPNKDIRYVILAEYVDPGLIGPDSGAGMINCTSESRTTTISIYVTDKAGTMSNVLTDTLYVNI